MFVLAGGLSVPSQKASAVLRSHPGAKIAKRMSQGCHIFGASWPHKFARWPYRGGVSIGHLAILLDIHGRRAFFGEPGSFPPGHLSSLANLGEIARNLV
jgi:hypothetical protein